MRPTSSIDQVRRLAGVPRRLGAYVLDCLLLFAGLVAFHALVYVAGLNPIINETLATTGPNVHLWVFCTATLPILVYFWLSFRRGATLGMRLLGLQVSSADRTPLSSRQALVRAMVLLFPFELNHVIWSYPQPAWLDTSPGFRLAALLFYAVLAIYLVLPFLNAKCQSVHDWVARSVVIPRASGQ